ncbi:50S ribosomal protein L18 [Frankliniella fusca]|uniref:50S ribosomal protein L18 n=1 Tax=Frankliniella fusca TaxID=407009 RepID=A0AAE1LNN5_9NEOP|nr:50S ribosomal protein L18 [Frankliniella fusca]
MFTGSNSIYLHFSSCQHIFPVILFDSR